MHPYWIQKIEESRRSAVTTFWIVTFLVVVLPIILVMKVDMFIVIAIVCFAGAGLRMFSQGKSEMMVRAEAAQAKMQRHAMPESGASGLAVGTQSGQQWQATQANTFPGPQFSNGVPTMSEFASSQPHGGVPTEPFGNSTEGMPSFAAQPAPEGFFNGAIAPGLPLIGEPQNFSAQQETGPLPAMPDGQPAVQPAAHPKRPMHFHDLARH